MFITQINFISKMTLPVCFHLLRARQHEERWH